MLGWTKQGKYLVPDPHRQNVIASAPLPTTVKNLRSYLGAYRTFFRCKKEMSSILADLEELQAGKPSAEKLKWSKDLEQSFEASKKKILDLDKLYLPTQEKGNRADKSKSVGRETLKLRYKFRVD